MENILYISRLQQWKKMLTYNTTMFVLAEVKKFAQNMGTSYSASGKTAKSKTCISSRKNKRQWAYSKTISRQDKIQKNTSAMIWPFFSCIIENRFGQGWWSSSSHEDGKKFGLGWNPTHRIHMRRIQRYNNTTKKINNIWPPLFSQWRNYYFKITATQLGMELLLLIYSDLTSKKCKNKTEKSH